MLDHVELHLDDLGGVGALAGQRAPGSHVVVDGHLQRVDALAVQLVLHVEDEVFAPAECDVHA